MQEFRPALRIDGFFETLFRLAREGKLDAEGKPSNFLQTAVLVQSYWDEIRVTQPPVIFQRMLTLLAPIARLLGYRA